ncbi:molybdopterin-binding protein [Gordonibacter sp. Marseille-P4307]|uniref:TOBE domain-containing protein n=1 Tax=Gordonibacter sp. Marseille-P4307 TaxID=2161815 RepID=UPI000F52F9DB|nr:TOBE domain-containing protein [Gordonibacter sp. Marseille-P4307]
MRISARNQFEGTVKSVTDGAVNSIVAIEVGSSVIKANITSEAVKDLGLATGGKAVAIVKATNVVFASGSAKIAGISARNQIAGKVVSVTEGAVNSHVVLETVDGLRICGSITNEAVESLGFAVGSDAVALIKSTDVIVGVE